MWSNTSFSIILLVLVDVLLTFADATSLDRKNLINLSLGTKRYLDTGETLIDLSDPRRRLQSNNPRTQTLYQGFGAYYVDIWVGSPAQHQSLLVDTGSDNTALPCSECIDCGHEHVYPPFNEMLSNSFQYLKCSQCKNGHCDVREDTCKIRSEYAEESAWEGKEIQDLVHLDNYTENGFRAKMSCMKIVEGDPFKNQLPNGIMELGPRKGSFLWQMYEQGFIESKKFSICLDHHPISRSVIGRLSLGGVDERLGHTASAMNYMDFADVNGYYEVNIRHLYLTQQQEGIRGGIMSKAIKKDDTIPIDIDEKTINQGGVIIDSGTTATIFTPELKVAFDEAWGMTTGNPFPVEPVKISPKELKKWPTIVLQMRGSSKKKNSTKGKGSIFDEAFPEDVIVALPPSHYMLLDLKTQKYIPTIKFDGKYGEGSILGTNFMRSHNTLFDIENEMIGMIRSNCNFANISHSKESIRLPSQYANLHEIAIWYNNDKCNRGHDGKCQHTVDSKFVINFLLCILLCLVIYTRPNGAESKKRLPSIVLQK